MYSVGNVLLINEHNSLMAFCEDKKQGITSIKSLVNNFICVVKLIANVFSLPFWMFQAKIAQGNLSNYTYNKHCVSVERFLHVRNNSGNTSFLEY